MIRPGSIVPVQATFQVGLGLDRFGHRPELDQPGGVVVVLVGEHFSDLGLGQQFGRLGRGHQPGPGEQLFQGRAAGDVVGVAVAHENIVDLPGVGPRPG